MRKSIISRIISIVCVCFMLTACLPANSADIIYNPKLDLPEPEALTMRNGTLVIEAEDITLTEAYAIIDDANASGGKGIKSTAAEYRPNPDSNAGPDASISFRADSGGSAYVWARIQTPSTGGDSLWVSTQGNNMYGQVYFTIPSPVTKYHWANLGTVTLKTGINTNFNIQYRELDLVLDKFVITTDANFAPVGKDDVPSGDGSAPSYEGLYPEPPIKPISGHPRLWLTKDDIPKILANSESELGKPHFDKIVELADMTPNGMLDPTKADNFNTNTLSQIQNRALLYALGLRDKNHARVAIDEMKNYLSTVLFNPTTGDITRQMGVTIMTAAAVYDWCYDIMTGEDKEDFIKLTKVIARQKEIGYPPVKLEQERLSGHGGEGELFGHLLSAGIAYYDEDTEIYNLAAGRIFQDMVDARVMWNKTGAHPVGLSYGTTRFGWELIANLMYIRMGYEDGILGDFDDLSRVTNRQTYARLPNGYFMKWGDDWMWPAVANKSWFWSTYATEVYNLAATQTDDSFVQQSARIDNYVQGYPTYFNSITCLPAILLINTDTEAKGIDEMPLANKTSYPLTSVQARTNWLMGMDSNAAIVSMEGREKMIKDHNHADIGSFQLYYKGNLAINAGTYNGTSGGWGSSHYYNYYTRTIAHNAMTIYDPDEYFYENYHTKTGLSLSNDGGQINPQWVNTYEDYMNNPDEAKTKAWYIGPNKQTPEFSFLKTDLTNAYGNGKTKKHQRSMVFIDLDNNDYPAALVVFDDVESSNANFRKAWIMNTQLEPEVNGDTTTVIRNDNGNNGKLVNKTFLPENPEITKVGGEGKESWVDGVNYESKDKAEGIFSEQGQWRFEISPSKQSKRDYFLNSMYVTDYDRNLPELKMYQEETSKVYGVTIRDRAVYFPKNNSISGSVNITLRDNGFDDVKVLVTDIKSGNWSVTNDADGSAVIYTVNEDENTLYFRGKKGASYTISSTDAAPQEIYYNEMNKPKYGDFMVYNRENKMFYSFTAPTILKDGKYFVPIRTLFETNDISVNWDNGVVTVKGTVADYKFTEGSYTYEKDGIQYTMNDAPFVQNGTMYINIKDVDMFKGVYDASAKILGLFNVAKDYSVYEEKGFGNFAVPLEVTAISNDGNIEQNMFDGKLDTRWSCDINGAWAKFEFEEVTKLDEIAIAFYSGAIRATKFKLEVSTDGKNYAEVYNGASSGTTDEFESFKLPQPTDVKFVKITGYGNTLNAWNSIAEIIFLKGE